MDNNFLFLCVLQVTLANESIMLYMCSGKYNDIFFLNENNMSSSLPLSLKCGCNVSSLVGIAASSFPPVVTWSGHGVG